MSLDIYKFSELAQDQQYFVASYVSAFTNAKLGETPQMLKVSEVDILNKYAAYVAFNESVFSGYVGATEPLQHNDGMMVEVGNLIVLPEFRRQGIAHKLVEAMTSKLAKAGELPYAFCNSLSLPIFESAGYINVTSEAIPPAAFCLCNSCRKKPASGCCDSMLIFTGDV
jgi:N-acetylglutamate synthase-like GNAT family acetyltransferase